jgi:hypothetical protein
MHVWLCYATFVNTQAHATSAITLCAGVAVSVTPTVLVRLALEVCVVVYSLLHIQYTDHTILKKFHTVLPYTLEHWLMRFACIGYV